MFLVRTHSQLCCRGIRSIQQVCRVLSSQYPSASPLQQLLQATSAVQRSHPSLPTEAETQIPFRANWWTRKEQNTPQIFINEAEWWDGEFSIFTFDPDFHEREIIQVD